MTAFQDLQATAWRDVAIGEIPEIVVYRNPQGTFTRSVTAGFIVAVLIQLLVRGKTSAAVPYYGIGVFMPIMVMGFAIRKHILLTAKGAKRVWGSLGAGFAARAFRSGLRRPDCRQMDRRRLGGVDLLQHPGPGGQPAVDLSRSAVRDPKDIHRIVREKARVQGSMASIVEWQSLKMQEYRYSVLVVVTRFLEMFGVRRPLRFETPYRCRRL